MLRPPARDLGPLAAFPENAVRVVRAGETEVGIVRWRERLYAVRNVCPHRGGPVCAGRLGPRLLGPGVGEMAVDAGRPTLMCAWHAWEFDLETGRAVSDERYRVVTYPVRVEEGRVVLDQPRAHGAPAARAARRERDGSADGR